MFGSALLREAQNTKRKYIKFYTTGDLTEYP
jgi:hypothetical protein